MKWKPYPAYKESGVEWLGAVPEHWEVKPLGFTASVKARLGWKGLKAEEYVDDGYPMLATPNIKEAGIDFENVVYVSEERYRESPEIMVQEGDILLAKDGSTLGTVNVVRQLPRPSTLNGSIALIRPGSSLRPLFGYYWFKGRYVANQIQAIKGGMGVPHLFQSDLRKFRALIPPEVEQDSVAAFLDRETAKIDTLISKQEHLIELLQEKRQALISHAVTKGLNPDAPMKPSGVEWLGEVPAHWELKPLQRVVRTGTSITYGIVQAGPHVEDGIPYIRTSDMSGDALPQDGYPRTSLEIDASYQRSKVRCGDLVVAIRATVGKALRVPLELDGANLTQGTARVSPGAMVDGTFLLHFLNSKAAQSRFAELAKGATFKEITLDMLRRFAVLVPPREEAQNIGSWLNEKIAQFDTLMRKVRLSVDLMREHRTALISAAVTGKIDVRNHPSALDELPDA